MTVTKQQQLEWLASSWSMWHHSASKLFMSKIIIGCFVSMIDDSHQITLEEWRQERGKMSSKPEADNSWHERGELPPVGGVCEAMINGEWIAAEVLRHRINSAGMNVAAVMSCASFGVYWAADFRSIRTEREKAIDEISALVRDGLVSPEMAKEFAIKMYDAGLKVVKR